MYDGESNSSCHVADHFFPGPGVLFGTTLFVVVCASKFYKSKKSNPAVRENFDLTGCLNKLLKDLAGTNIFVDKLNGVDSLVADPLPNGAISLIKIPPFVIQPDTWQYLISKS